MATLLVGDVHGDKDFLGSCFFVAEAKGANRILQLGDFGWAWPRMKLTKKQWGERYEPVPQYELEKLAEKLVQRFGIPLYAIDGNHENHDELDHDADEFVPKGDGVFYVPRGLAWEWDDKRWLSMGGAYSIDLRNRTPGVSWWPEETPCWEQIDRANKRGKVDVVVSHDAPWGVDVPGEHAAGKVIHRPSRWTRKGLASILDACQPQFWFHGHHHVRYTADLGSCLVQGLASNFDPHDARLVFG